MDAHDISRSFCVVPWLHRFIDERGFLKVCCVAEGDGNFLTDARGKRLHIQGEQTESEIFNSSKLKELRRKMLAGEWDSICTRCLAFERGGGSSSRTGRNHHFRRRIPELLSDTDAGGAITTPAIRHIDMRLGNYCNLTCRMCSPGASKLWIAPYNRVQPDDYKVEASRLSTLRNIEWVADPNVWTRFREQLPDVEWLNFAGGEPMMIPEMIAALRMCVDSGLAGGIRLSYNTNITLLPKELTELWPAFKSVSLKCSIDGYGSLNEYIRRPSRWQDVDRHLHTLDARFKEWNLRQVSINTTVQAYNVLDLDKLYSYLRSEFQHILPAPDLSPLTWPSYLSVQHLPDKVKALARDRLLLEKTRREYQDHSNIAWLLDSIDAVVDTLDGSAAPEHWSDFLTFTERSEREFGDSLERAAPELCALLAPARRYRYNEAAG